MCPLLNLQQGQFPELCPGNYLLLALLIGWQRPIEALLGKADILAGRLKPGPFFLAGAFGNLTTDILRKAFLLMRRITRTDRQLLSQLPIWDCSD